MGNQTEHKDRIHAGSEWRGGERGREEDRDKTFFVCSERQFESTLRNL